MKVFINPGHFPGRDPGACGFGLREAEVAAKIGAIVEQKLKAAGIQTKNLQSDYLSSVPVQANEWGADLFVSIHCNAFNGVAKGTEVLVYRLNSQGATLAQSVQNAIVKNLDTLDRGLKERPGLCVLRATDMPSILIESAFIDEEQDNSKLAHRQEEFADAIAVGIFAYAGINAMVNIADTRLIAPNGQPYEQNDIDYLLGEGYALADALSFLDTTDKYSCSDIKAAAAYAESRVGTTGYGNNGCTEWVRQFLLKANHPFGQLMTDGSQGVYCIR